LQENTLLAYTTTMVIERMDVLIFKNLSEIRDLLTFDIDVSTGDQVTRQVNLYRDIGEPLNNSGAWSNLTKCPTRATVCPKISRKRSQITAKGQDFSGRR